MEIKLGQRVRDVISGFSGTVTGTVRYITGCNQVLVQPPAKPDGASVDSAWVDVSRIEVIEEPSAELLTRFATALGPDKAAPRQ